MDFDQCEIADSRKSARGRATGFPLVPLSGLGVWGQWTPTYPFLQMPFFLSGLLKEKQSFQDK